LERLYLCAMKIAFSQLNYHIGNFQANTRRIIERVKEAEASGAELIVFTELSICGYPPQDFLEFNDLSTVVMRPSMKSPSTLSI
jgi:NAD+ synthase (glutamine-hydrolysing)